MSKASLFRAAIVGAALATGGAAAGDRRSLSADSGTTGTSSTAPTGAAAPAVTSSSSGQTGQHEQ